MLWASEVLRYGKHKEPSPLPLLFLRFKYHLHAWKWLIIPSNRAGRHEKAAKLQVTPYPFCICRPGAISASVMPTLMPVQLLCLQGMQCQRWRRGQRALLGLFLQFYGAVTPSLVHAKRKIRLLQQDIQLCLPLFNRGFFLQLWTASQPKQRCPFQY